MKKTFEVIKTVLTWLIVLLAVCMMLFTIVSVTWGYCFVVALLSIYIIFFFLLEKRRIRKSAFLNYFA